MVNHFFSSLCNHADCRKDSFHRPWFNILEHWSLLCITSCFESFQKFTFKSNLEHIFQTIVLQLPEHQMDSHETSLPVLGHACVWRTTSRWWYAVFAQWCLVCCLKNLKLAGSLCCSAWRSRYHEQAILKILHWTIGTFYLEDRYNIMSELC